MLLLLLDCCCFGWRTRFSEGFGAGAAATAAAWDVVDGATAAAAATTAGGAPEATAAAAVAGSDLEGRVSADGIGAGSTVGVTCFGPGRRIHLKVSF